MEKNGNISFFIKIKNIFDFDQKEMLPLTEEKLFSYHDAKICYICGTRILKTFAEDIKYQKVTVHRHYTGKYRGATHSLCNLKFNVLNEIPVNVQRVSNYDYHFIIKELAKELEEQFEFKSVRI